MYLHTCINEICKWHLKIDINKFLLRFVRVCTVCLFALDNVQSCLCTLQSFTVIFSVSEIAPLIQHLDVRAKKEFKIHSNLFKINVCCCCMLKLPSTECCTKIPFFLLFAIVVDIVVSLFLFVSFSFKDICRVTMLQAL